MKPVDAHCHLYFEDFDKDRDKIIEKTKKKLEFVAVPGVNIESNKKVLKLSEKYPEFIIPNLGLHPTYKDCFNQVEKIKDQIRREDPPAIGEIGLDHHHITDEDERKKQEKVFRELLRLAEKLEKPVIVHSREAERKAFNILKEYEIPEVMLHCFNGSTELAEEALEQGMKIGVTTQVLYSTRVQKIVKSLDIEDILLETDSPYLYRGERNEPVNVIESAEEISNIKDISKDKVIEATTKNAKKIHRRI